MPVSAHFKGKGLSVMKDMIARYGKAKGERVFYAVESKQKSEKGEKKRPYASLIK